MGDIANNNAMSAEKSGMNDTLISLSKWDLCVYFVHGEKATTANQMCTSKMDHAFILFMYKQR
jgi:hypothetical protein